MCHFSGLLFATVNLPKEEISGKRILEVGAIDVNGSVRPFLEKLNPSAYIGVDLVMGKGVDEICRIEELENKFGAESFDIVIATEVLEHVLDWRLAISNLKRVCGKNGVLVITTRSQKFKYHGYPYDFWRYDVEDFKKIFSDFQLEKLEADPSAPGVFLLARKPDDFIETRLDGHSIYSVLLDRKIQKIDEKKLQAISRRKFQSLRIRKKIIHVIEKVLLLK